MEGLIEKRRALCCNSSTPDTILAYYYFHTNKNKHIIKRDKQQKMTEEYIESIELG